MGEDVEPVRPFRWDLVRPDQLGSLVGELPKLKPWFVEELTDCAGKVLARSGGGELNFVGRSADSVHDLLGGALAGTSWRERLRILPLSMGYGKLTGPELRLLRANLALGGLHPSALARASKPIVFVDLVFRGNTFTWLYRVLREWIDADREPWPVIRRKLRFIGITERAKTSPNAYRWQQDRDWTTELPASAIVNVSIDWALWHYLGDVQAKVTASFPRSRWADTAIQGPRRDDDALNALAEALALVEHGRAEDVRSRLAGVLAREPTVAESWSRSLALELRGKPA